MPITNIVAQHYLIHLLKEKLVESKTRIVFVSSGAIRGVKDTGPYSFPHSALSSIVLDGKLTISMKASLTKTSWPDLAQVPLIYTARLSLSSCSMHTTGGDS